MVPTQSSAVFRVAVPVNIKHETKSVEVVDRQKQTSENHAVPTHAVVSLWMVYDLNNERSVERQRKQFE